MKLEKIRNFWIIAHIDHGKSTLADRLLEITWTINKRDIKAQTLDTMDLEQERWITIKLTPVRMKRKDYEFNMIDTPWHVDFQYEVSRSLASVEWCLLIVDATQWIEAQTLSNVYMALENNLDIIPIINKIDLPSADTQKVINEIVHLLWCDKNEIIPVSAKTWLNIEKVLDAVINRVRMPQIYNTFELKALVFDSQYDSYRWVVSYVKVFSWEIKKWDILYFLNTWKKIEALDVGYFSPKYITNDIIETWSIWYIVTWLKSIRDAKVWDTVWKPADVLWAKEKKENAKAIEWFKKVIPFIYAWVFPVDSSAYPVFKASFEKLMLNDSALVIEPESSWALGHGYRCWFLWLLHLDIIKERLFREFNMDVIITSPQVTYKVKMLNKNILNISNPCDLPPRELYEYIEEPIAKCEIITQSQYIWPLMKLAQDRRWIFINQTYIDGARIILTYELPMNELIWDFYDELKSISSWYASLNYEFLKYTQNDLVKLDILIAWEKIDPLSLICHRTQAQYIWWKIVKKLKEVIPRSLFTIAIQAAIWWKVVAREDLSALRKDVIAKLYWGDVSRKKKLLEKQKQWKKRMKQFWKVNLPSDAFINLLKK